MDVLVEEHLEAFIDRTFDGGVKVKGKTMKDELLMWKNGEMLILRDHEMIALQEEMLLLDGTRIALDGKVIMKDGTWQALVEGQTILVESQAPG